MTVVSRNIGRQIPRRGVTGVGESAFFHWLLNPNYFGTRIREKTRKDLRILKAALDKLRSLSRPASDQLHSAMEEMAARKQIWRMHTWRSPIMQWSSERPGNLEEAKRLFAAALIARKHRRNPYQFLSNYLADNFRRTVEAKAIEMRVRRLECRLEAQGPMSVRGIVEFLYSQFKTMCNGHSLTELRSSLDTGKITFSKFKRKASGLVGWGKREARWLDSLAQQSASAAATEDARRPARNG